MSHGYSEYRISNSRGRFLITRKSRDGRYVYIVERLDLTDWGPEEFEDFGAAMSRVQG